MTASAVSRPDARDRLRSDTGAPTGEPSRRSVAYIVAVIVMGAMLIGSSAVAWKAHRQQVELDAIYSDTLQVLIENNRIRLGALNALRGERGYLLTDDESYLGPYVEGRAEMLGGLEKLAGLTGRVTIEPATLASLREETHQYLAHIDRVDALHRRGDHAKAIGVVMTGRSREAISGMDKILDQIATRERGHLAQVTARAHQIYMLTIVFAGIVAVTGLALLATAASSLYALNRSLDRETRYRRELQTLALTDELTRLPNRRAFGDALAKAVEDAARQASPVSLAVFDIDHFKRINDTFGHACGDTILAELARRAQACMRAGDLVARIGGEEFAVLLPGASDARALTACERLLNAIHATPFTLEHAQSDIGPDNVNIAPAHEKAVNVTVSIGLAQMRAQDTPDLLMKRADDALYDAKHQGRDRVCEAA